MVFFNQNSSSLSQDSFKELSTIDLWTLSKHWTQSYFVSCILPFYIIQTLKKQCVKDTQVVWMLSSYVYAHPDRPEQIGHADYISNKYQNYAILKNFSINHPACFFGITPEKSHDLEDDVKLLELIKFITSADNKNGKVFYLDGTEDKHFDNFNNINI